MKKEDKKEEVIAAMIDIVATCKECEDRTMKIPKAWENNFIGKGWRLK